MEDLAFRVSKKIKIRRLIIRRKMQKIKIMDKIIQIMKIHIKFHQSNLQMKVL